MADKYTLERDLGGGVQMCETGGEYTLPDYMPEVRRVLRTRCHSAVGGQYASQGRCSVGGECTYQVLYTDEEGKLASTLQEGTFEWETPMEEGTQLFVREGSESVSCRPVGPRRLSLRAGVPLEHFLVKEEEMEEPKAPAEAGEVAVLRHAVEAGRTVLGHSGDLPMSESVRAEPNSKVLSWEGQVLMRELTCESGGMHARGEVWLSALLTDGEGNPYTVRCKVPFEEMLSGGDVEATAAVGGGNCRGMSCTLTQEEGGDRLTFDFLLDLWGIGVQNQTLMPVGDLYALGNGVKCHTRLLEFREYPVARMANFTVDGTPDQHATEEGALPVDCVGDAFVTSCEAKGGEVIVEGEIRANCLLRQKDGYAAHPMTLPYRVRISCGEGVPDGTALTPFVTCVQCHAREDGGKILMDAELAVAVLGRRSHKMRVVDSVEADCTVGESTHPGDMAAVYLKDGDSVWEIGKRYGVLPQRVIYGNSLPEETMEHLDNPHYLDGVSRLLLEW